MHRFKAGRIAISLFIYGLAFFMCATSFAARSKKEKMSAVEKKEGYVINFDNVSIKEYIGFIGKIAGTNFIYEENALNFNVTIKSEEPTSLVNIMSALMQILKMHGLGIVEQGNNLLITKSGAINQIATVVSDEHPLKGDRLPAVMTRVFKLANANPATVAKLVTPLLSQDAILEVSAETRHLIITDITHNIEQIRVLLLSIDNAQTPLEIDCYTAKNHSPESLIQLVDKIITPVAEGNPVIFVPQGSTRSIFVVSTPRLIEKSIMILEDLDVPPLLTRNIVGSVTGDNLFLYHIVNKPADVLRSAIRKIESDLSKMGNAAKHLINTLGTMRYIRESHALFFTGDPHSLANIGKILSELDIPASGSEEEYVKNAFHIYGIRNESFDRITSAIRKLVASLKKTPHPDTDFIDAVASMTPIKENRSLLFIGDKYSIDRLKALLPLFDTSTDRLMHGDFFLYSPKNLSGKELVRQIREVAESLEREHLNDESLLPALKSAHWVESAYSLVFVGSTQAIDRIRALVTAMDEPEYVLKKTDLYVHIVRHVEPRYLHEGLNGIAGALRKSDPVAEVLTNIKYVDQTRSFIVQGPASAVARVRDIILSIDTAEIGSEQTTTFPGYDTYPLKHVTGSFVIKMLEQTIRSLHRTDKSSPLIRAIRCIEWNEEANVLILTGKEETLGELKDLIARFDTPELQTSEFYVYHPEHMDVATYLARIREVTPDLSRHELADRALLRTLRTAERTADDTAVLFIGTPESITALRGICPVFDAKDETRKTEFYFYKPLSADAVSFTDNMLRIGENMAKSGLYDPPLIAAVRSAHLSIGDTAVMFTGTPNAIEQIKAMLPSVDASSVAKQANPIFFYTPLHVSAEEIIRASVQAAKELEGAKQPDQGLIAALKSGKVVALGRSVLFIGTASAIDRLPKIVSVFDGKKASLDEVYVYEPRSTRAIEWEQRSSQVADKLKSAGLNDPELLHALKSAKATPAGDAVAYVGTTESLAKLRELITTYDTSLQEKKVTRFAVYQPVNMSPTDMQKRMADAAQRLRRSGLENPDFIKTLQSVQVASEGRSVLFLGTASAVEQVADLAKEYDTHSQAPEKVNDFLVYTPNFLPTSDLLARLDDIADNMTASGLADSALIRTLKTAKGISGNLSVLFIGTQTAITGVRELLPGVDQRKASDIPPTTKTGFFTYKIRYASGPVLVSHLKGIALDLSRSHDASERDFIKTLEHLRYLPESNSITFIGTPQALQQARELAAKFDVPELKEQSKEKRSPSGYDLYQPKYLPGEELIGYMQHFQQNLLASQVRNIPLFEAINHLKWLPKVSSILVSGNEKERKEIIVLLEKFDKPIVPKITETKRAPILPLPETSRVGFLVHRLQYHTGSEIQSALKTIGSEFAHADTRSESTKELVDAIKSIQWVRVTNSLIATGSPDALTQLKELIKNIDTPLKQVFVEVLVLETTIDNSLNFGLRWGSQGTFRNRFAYGTGGFPQPPGNNVDAFTNFSRGLQGVSATAPPQGNMIPLVAGFDLGVIGNIILHKGKSYFALGSLINAIKAESDSTVALNQKVVTQDNKNARIFVGQNVPYIGSVVSNTGNNTLTNSNLEYRDVGVNLSITPQIGDDGTVTLDIDEEITQQVQNQGSVNSTDARQTGLIGITTSKTSTQTSVTVPDKSFLVLSGQINNSKTKTKTQIPCLGGIPWIGAAFAQHDTLTNKTAVLIFVRPHIVHSFDVYKEISTGQEELHREQVRDAETFDEGLELVKTADDAA
ncbi:MAG: hypothetical protein OXF02_08040 [Simkaniaceae bacterium]|nr:hypothetical protein [Simkaniaceae bacterium]